MNCFYSKYIKLKRQGLLGTTASIDVVNCQNSDTFVSGTIQTSSFSGTISPFRLWDEALLKVELTGNETYATANVSYDNSYQVYLDTTDNLDTSYLPLSIQTETFNYFFASYLALPVLDIYATYIAFREEKLGTKPASERLTVEQDEYDVSVDVSSIKHLKSLERFALGVAFALNLTKVTTTIRPYKEIVHNVKYSLSLDTFTFAIRAIDNTLQLTFSSSDSPYLIHLALVYIDWAFKSNELGNGYLPNNLDKYDDFLQNWYQPRISKYKVELS